MRRLLALPALLLALAGFTGLLATASGSSPVTTTGMVQLYSGPMGARPSQQAHLRTGPLATSRAPTDGTLAWHRLSFPEYGFSVDFPYVLGSKHNFETHSDYTSATSVTGHLKNFTSNVWVADSGHGYCSGEFTDGCNPEGRHNEYYFVEIIHSKYADPWQALSAINGGVGPHPVFIRVHGYLTCTFKKGIYGGPGLTVWAHQRVYYLESANLALKANPHDVVVHFLGSIRFIPVSRR